MYFNGYVIYLQMLSRLCLPAVLVVCALLAPLVLPLPLEATQDLTLRRTPLGSNKPGYMTVDFPAVHDCRSNATLNRMCTQCGRLAMNRAATFHKCCADSQRVRDWCIDFINYIIN